MYDDEKQYKHEKYLKKVTELEEQIAELEASILRLDTSDSQYFANLQEKMNARSELIEERDQQRGWKFYDIAIAMDDDCSGSRSTLARALYRFALALIKAKSPHLHEQALANIVDHLYVTL